jgi:glycosyltransferase involved in cell wall biosynthesis
LNYSPGIADIALIMFHSENLTEKWNIGMIRILHVLQDKDKRSRLFENLVYGLRQKRFDQTICYLRGDSENKNPLETQGYRVINLEGGELRRFKPCLVFELARIIREKKIDLVHCQRHKPTVYGTLASWIARGDVKVVTTVHGRNRTRNLGRKLTNWLLFNRISRIVSVSEAVKKDILKCNPGLKSEKVVTIYNGIETKLFGTADLSQAEAKKKLGLSENAHMVFGTVGRLASVKGQATLIEAFKKVNQKFPDTWLLLTGSGPLEKDLKSLCQKLEISHRVRFLGYRTDIPMILRAYDCFVLPSLSEGHPLSLLEAMASGIYVIASRVGGIPEILNRHDLGIIIPPASVDHLARAMERVCRMSGQKRQNCGRKLKDRVENAFTNAHMVSATAQLYDSVFTEAAQ